MNYKNINDYELLYLISEDQEYYGTIIMEKYHPLINKFTMKYQNLAKQVGLEETDLLQVGYLALFDAVRNYQEDSKASFSTFAYICIKRRILNSIKVANSGKHKILNNSISLNNSTKEGYQLEDVIPGLDDLEIEILRDEFYRILNEFKWSLSPKESMMFELHLNSFKIKEIAILLDCSRQVVSSIIVRIRKKLKIYLQHLGICYN